MKKNNEYMYEVAEQSDYGLWVIKDARTEAEAKAECERLNKRGSVFMQAVYRKKP